jgi:hypothetical protein
VAVYLYASIWLRLDESSYFVLPTSVYEWLDRAVAPTTQDATADLEEWSTAIVVVLGLHVIAGIAFSMLKLLRCGHGAGWRCWQEKIVAAVGWMSWLLVCTVAFLTAGDEMYEVFTGISPNHVGNKLVVFAGTFAVVGLFHVAAVTVHRYRAMNSP